MKGIVVKTFGVIALGLLCLFAGMFIGFCFESFFRTIIQDIFRFSTSNKIHFFGKNFHIFSVKYFEYFLGLGVLLFLFSNLRLKTKSVLKNLLICLLLFGISLFLIASIYANIKVIECTNCRNGIRNLHWNDINYSFIISTSVIISVIPSIIRIIKRVKR